MKKNIIITISSVWAVFILNSCIELDTAPLNSDTDLTYWQQPSSAIETVNSCYRWIGSANEIIYLEGTTDNAYVRNGNTQSIGNGSYSTADNYVASFWSDRYAGIKMCNQLTQNIQHVPGLTDELRNRYLAEARVIRALHYHELAIRYGNIPYFTHVISVQESGTIEKSTRETVIANILSELDEVLNGNHLPKSYSASDRGRITHWAAKALKARILLNEGRYAELISITGDIIANSNHELHLEYEQLFQTDYENNKEVMISIQYALNLRENQGNYQFLPPSLAGIANIVPLKSLVDNYIMLNGKGIDEEGSGYLESDPWKDRDPRLAATICYDGGHYVRANGDEHVVLTDPSSGSNDRLQPGTSVITTTTGYYFKKYYDNHATTAQKSGLDYIIIRYADVLLMHAEACAETGTLNAQEWDKTIGKIRQRAGFTLASAIGFPEGKSQQELINIVRRERRAELAFEGLRLKDIVRWRTSDNVMNGKVHGMYIGDVTGTENGYYVVETRVFDKARHYLWPMPQSEKDINENLGQNPGW